MSSDPATVFSEPEADLARTIHSLISVVNHRIDKVASELLDQSQFSLQQVVSKLNQYYSSLVMDRETLESRHNDLRKYVEACI